MQDNKNAKFIKGSLNKHVVTMTLTSSLGILAIFVVDLIDIFFISMLGSENLAAAAGYASTLLFFTNSMNIGLSIAAGTLVARSLGENRKQIAREYATTVTLVAILIGLVVPIVLLWDIHFFLGLIGAQGRVAELAAGYLYILLPGMVFMGLAVTGMAILRSYGDAKRAMYGTLIGAVVNALLDPIFIFVLDMELKGAATASLVARFSFAFYALYNLFKIYQAYAKPCLQRFKRDLKETLSIGVPAILTNTATPVGGAIITRELAHFGSEAVAGMAIIGRLMPVAFSVIFALSGAIGPIIAQNFGAKLQKRIKETYLKSLLFAFLYILIASALLFLLRSPITSLFKASGLAKDLIFLFCGPLALTQMFNGTIYVSNASFNNLGHPLYSTWINWGRNTLGTLPFVLIGAKYWGAEGVLIGQAAGGFLFAVIAFFLASMVVNNPNKKQFARAIRWTAFLKHQRDHIIY